jgi:hypothetical protein
LTEKDGAYYVRDGHHRISVARALGESFIEAEVVRIQTHDGMLEYHRRMG